MNKKLMYIEFKAEPLHRGPAWIGLASLSKSGRTVYFNDRALKRFTGGGLIGNHYDLETGEDVWVSGPKKKGQDRHWAGGGLILVDPLALAEYLEFRGLSELDPKLYRVDPGVRPTDVSGTYGARIDAPQCVQLGARFNTCGSHTQLSLCSS